jgi:formate hydrogenlyase subunit 4
MALLLNILLPLLAAPLLPGVINRTKAVFAGRRGQPLFQLYYDLWKLLHKGSVYSTTTSWVLRAGPVVGLAAVVAASMIVPLGAVAPLSFAGDLVLLAYLLGLMRFFTVLAALDTGSAFEGMGASREVTFAALAEPAFLLGLATLATLTGALSLSGMLAGVSWAHGSGWTAELALVAGAVLIVFLAENARLPVDDPNTHLELTMIHEVMVLDHGGVELGFIQYASSLKLWVLGAMMVGVVIPVRTGQPLFDLAVGLAGLAALAVLVGVIESVMARLKLVRLPQLLVAAMVLSLLAVAWVLR